MRNANVAFVFAPHAPSVPYLFRLVSKELPCCRLSFWQASVQAVVSASGAHPTSTRAIFQSATLCLTIPHHKPSHQLEKMPFLLDGTQVKANYDDNHPSARPKSSIFWQPSVGAQAKGLRHLGSGRELPGKTSRRVTATRDYMRVKSAEPSSHPAIQPSRSRWIAPCVHRGGASSDVK